MDLDTHLKSSQIEGNPPTANKVKQIFIHTLTHKGRGREKCDYYLYTDKRCHESANAVNSLGYFNSPHSGSEPLQ